MPDTSDWPEAFTRAMEEANDALFGKKGWVEGLGELAMLFHANAFLKEAETCYTLLNESDPGEARWPYFLADIRLNWGDLASAESLLNRVVDLQPAYLPALLRLGDVFLKSGQAKAAHEVYLKCLQLESNNAYALLGLAREHLRDGEEEKALPMLLQLVENNPTFAAGHMLLAQVLESRGEDHQAKVSRALGRKYGRYREAPDPWMEKVMTRCYDLDRLMVLADIDVATRYFKNALEILDRAEKISPEYARLHLIRGFTYSEMGNKKSAIESYKEALHFGGDTVTIRGELVRLYKALGENKAAISMARTGLEEYPESPKLLTVLAEILIKQKDFKEADRLLRKALVENPSYLPAMQSLARALWEDGREIEAMEVFQEVRRLSPLDFYSRAFLAQYYLGKNDLEKAEAPLFEAIDLSSDTTELRELLLTFLLQSGNRKAREGDHAEAISDYRKALTTDPSRVDFNLNLGLVYVEMKDYEAAIENLKIYTGERPEDFRGWIMLGDATWEKGRHTEARDFWQKALGVAQGMRNSHPIIEAVEERLRRNIPGQGSTR